MRKNIKKYLIASIALGLMLGCSVFGLAGCKEDEGNSSTPGQSTPVEVTYTVSFETNGGTPVQSVTVKEGATIALSDYVTTKENHYFYSWTLDEALTVRADSSMEVNSNVKLYAEWGAEEKYLLTFETNGGSKIESVLYRPNAYLATPENPTKNNYVFAGWYKDAEFTKEFSFYAAPQMPKKPLTIYAKWEAMNAIVFETNGGTPIETVYGAVGDPVEIEAPTKSGFIFEGWYKESTLKTPYDVSMIPQGVVTVYAKWHEQAKGINVRLHVNYGDLTLTKTVTGNEGETFDAAAALAEFTEAVNAQMQDSYLGAAADLASKPIMTFSEWAYNANGTDRYEGVLPHESELDLYAVWMRSAAYCQVTFVEEDVESTYFVKKNTVIDASVLNTHTTSAKETYEQLGCTVEGFYTVGGNRYVAGDIVAMDMRLIPYVYSAGLTYEYVETISASGSEMKGYALKGYDVATAEANKAKDELLLLIPEFYNDGTHGQLPVIWIADNAFDGFNVNDVTLPSALLGIGAEAFKATKLTRIDLPANVYYLGDNAFSNSASLSEVGFGGTISMLGATIFSGTAYEDTMKRSNDFIFFDDKMSIVYGYEGTATSVTVPSTARTIGGAAFKGNTTIKTLKLSDGVRYVSDYAFSGSVIENVTLGKFFASMGVGIFKDCTKLTSVTFSSQYNLASLGVSMFEGCTALKSIDPASLSNLTAVQEKAFYGCSSLEKVNFNDTFRTLGASAFEKCSSLVSVAFGSGDASKFASIGNRAFADCTSLKRIVLYGDLINNAIVSFGTNVFVGAGYTKGGSFVAPVIYVKDKTVDNWRDDDDNPIYTYVEIYKMRLPSEYRNMVVKAIDSKAPDVTVLGVVELTAGASLAAFDLLAYLTDEGVYTVADNVSTTANCTVSIAEVVYQNGTKLTASAGKYNLSAVGAYTVKLVAEDEFGNVGEGIVNVLVK